MMPCSWPLVVLEHAVGQRRPVARGSSDHAMQSCTLTLPSPSSASRGFPPADVQEHRPGTESPRIIAVEEGIGLGPRPRRASSGSVFIGQPRAARFALPAPDDLRSRSRPPPRRAQRARSRSVLAVCRNAGVKLAQYTRQRAVACEHGRRRDDAATLLASQSGYPRMNSPGLIGSSIGTGQVNAAAFDRRLLCMIPSLKPNDVRPVGAGSSPCRQISSIPLVKLLLGSPRLFRKRFRAAPGPTRKQCQRHMHSAAFRAAIPSVWRHCRRHQPESAEGAAIPWRNSGAKSCRASPGATPSAFSPLYVKARIVIHACADGRGLIGQNRSGGCNCSTSSRPARRSSIRSSRYVPT